MYIDIYIHSHPNIDESVKSWYLIESKLKYFLRVIPTVKHYSDTVSDIPSGSTYGIFIMTCYLIFFLAYRLTFYLTFYLAPILIYFLAYILTFFLASILTFYLLAFYLTFSPASGCAHWDPELAVEVRQCPLISGAQGWGWGGGENNSDKA